MKRVCSFALTLIMCMMCLIPAAAVSDEIPTAMPSEQLLENNSDASISFEEKSFTSTLANDYPSLILKACNNAWRDQMTQFRNSGSEKGYPSTVNRPKLYGQYKKAPM